MADRLGLHREGLIDIRQAYMGLDICAREKGHRISNLTPWKMETAIEICNRSSLDKYNLIGETQKWGSVRGLCQRQGGTGLVCTFRFICVWLQNTVSMSLLMAKHWIALLCVASIKPILNYIPFLTSPLSNPAQVNISEHVSVLFSLYTLKILLVLLFYNCPYCKQILFEDNPAHPTHLPQKRKKKKDRWSNNN